jgi:peroxiredoxin
MKHKLLSLMVFGWALQSLGASLGKPAPDFSLKSADGQTWKLSDQKGKVVVLEWFNEGCPFVKKHYTSQNMQNLQKQYTAKGVV